MLHWNIHSWRDESGAGNVEAVIDLVRMTNPHVVSLVEVDEMWSGPSALKELASRGGYASIFAPTFEFGTHAPAGGFGNVLLTKLPILAVQQRQLVWPPRLYDGTEPSEPRSVLLVQLRFSSHVFWIGSTHLPRHDEDARRDALDRLAQLVQDLDNHWLLCGDFNTPAASWLDNHSSFTAGPDPSQPTYPASQPVEPIDYCICSDALLMKASVLPVPGSDHLPILVSCQLACS